MNPDIVNQMLREHWPQSDVRCLAVDTENALASLVPGSEHIRPGGYISGPAQFAVADSVLWFLVAGVCGRAEPMALTSELSIRFLRPAVGTKLMASASLERAGRRTVVATLRVWVDEREKEPSAVGQGTYFLPDQRA